MAQRVALSKDALFQEVSGEMVILDLASESYFGLNEVGARIWTLLDAGNTPEDAERTLIEEFDVAPEVLAADMDELLKQLADRGLIEMSDSE